MGGPSSPPGDRPHHAHDPDQEDQWELEPALPHQVTCHRKHRLLRDREPEVAEQDKHQQTEVAPLADQDLETFTVVCNGEPHAARDRSTPVFPVAYEHTRDEDVRQIEEPLWGYDTRMRLLEFEGVINWSYGYISRKEACLGAWFAAV